ncbi:MAG TPA: IPT/TIG domain-containing protein [Acidimicrobiales bacterium]|nr:IPT/TIG domain-containing protein [Acidimicrobiales bacterium]
MPEDADWADGLDRPRPLPEGLRTRLEEAILAAAGREEQARPLPAGLADDLGATLTDPVAALLAGADDPRALPDEVRGRLERRLGARRRPLAWLAGAAAAVLVAATISVVVHGGASDVPRGVASAPAGRAPGAGGSGFAAGGAGGNGGLVAGAGAGSVGNPLAQAPPTSAPASGAGGGAAGGPSVQGAVASPSAAPPTPPRPVVSGVSPQFGLAAGGNPVTITGSGFQPGDQVRFGATPARSVQFVSPTQLRVVAPAHPAGQVDVVVAGPGGTSAVNPADRYTFA